MEKDKEGEAVHRKDAKDAKEQFKGQKERLGKRGGWLT